MRRNLPGIVFIALLGGWLIFYRQVYFSDDFYYPRDNYEVSFPLFRYIVESLRAFHQFPSWVYSLQGGIWIEPLTNNYLILAPYRLIGYWLGYVGVSALIAYKISLLIGWGLFALGCCLLLHRQKRRTAWGLPLFLLFFSASGFNWLHSEQMLSTVFFVPYLWLTALLAKKDPKYWVLFAALLGQSFNTHYPQLILGYGLACLVAGYLFNRQFFQKVSLHHLVLGVLALLIAASPLLYSFASYQNSFRSPDRGLGESIRPNRYEEYRKMNTAGATSLSPDSLLTYFGAQNRLDEKMGELDENNLFASVAAPLALVFLPSIEGALGHFVVIFLLCLFSIGIYNPCLQFFWKFPGVAYFRQWFHFSEFLNLHLLYLVNQIPDMKLGKKNIIGASLFMMVLSLTGKFSPYFCLPPFLLFYLGWHGKKRYFRFVFWAWVIVGGIGWSEMTLNKVKRHPNWGRLYYANSSKPSAKLPVPWVGIYGEWKTLVLPKELDEKEANEKLLTASLWDNERSTPLTAAIASIENRELTFRNVRAKQVLFPQFNDGKWLLKINSQTIALPKSGPLLSFNLPDGVTAFSLTRRFSPWIILAAISVTPFFIALVCLLPRKIFFAQAETGTLPIG